MRAQAPPTTAPMGLEWVGPGGLELNPQAKTVRLIGQGGLKPIHNVTGGA